MEPVQEKEAFDLDAYEAQFPGYIRSEPIDCCELLRCKTMYYRPDERPGRLHESTSMSYWCETTQRLVGPDKAAATPRLCQAGRGCFKRDL